MDMLKRFQLQHVGDLDRSKVTDPAEVVAKEIRDHDQLRSFLFRITEFKSGLGIKLGIGETRTRSFDRACFDLPAREVQKGLGRRGKNFAPIEIQITGGGCGSGSTKFIVERKEPVRCPALGTESSRKVDLVDVAGRDVVLGRRDSLEEFRFGKGIFPGAQTEPVFRIGRAEFRRKRSCFPPLAALMVIDQKFGVETEGELTIVVDPSAGCSDRETVVPGFGLGPSLKGLLQLAGLGDATPEDLDRTCSDDRDRRVVFDREVAGGVKEDQSGKMGQEVRDFPGPMGEGNRFGEEGRGGFHGEAGLVDRRRSFG